MQYFHERRDLPTRGRRYRAQGELPMPAHGNPSFIITKVVPTCQQILAEGQQWPDRTDLACMWCEHTFDWAPVGAPVYHDAKRDVYRLKWNFCSFNCCKAWMQDKQLSSVSNIFWMATRLYGKKSEYRQRIEGIQAAPRKEALKKYGGWMSIEDFRANGMLIRPANAQAISVKWDPVQLAVQTGADDELATQSRAGLQARRPQQQQPIAVPAPLPRPKAVLSRPNSLDAFLKGSTKPRTSEPATKKPRTKK